jgi:hypothetical protein
MSARDDVEMHVRGRLSGCRSVVHTDREGIGCVLGLEVQGDPAREVPELTVLVVGERREARDMTARDDHGVPSSVGVRFGQCDDQG